MSEEKGVVVKCNINECPYYMERYKETNCRYSHVYGIRVNVSECPLYKREQAIDKQVEELKDFCIWMTGCGYDFTQHEYFIKQRDRLFKDKALTSEQEGAGDE